MADRVLGHGADGDINDPGEFAPEPDGKKKTKKKTETKSEEDK